jgi:hypothetical protein
MTLFFAVVVVPLTLLALASSLAIPFDTAPQDQERLATTSVPHSGISQVWKDPNIIEDLKNIEFDFDSQDLASEQLVLDATRTDSRIIQTSG